MLAAGLVWSGLAAALKSLVASFVCGVRMLLLLLLLVFAALTACRCSCCVNVAHVYFGTGVRIRIGISSLFVFGIPDKYLYSIRYWCQRRYRFPSVYIDVIFRARFSPDISISIGICIRTSSVSISIGIRTSVGIRIRTCIGISV